jgi:hypothetical protein
METNLVAEFIKSTGARKNDAISCLQSWGWDLKKALIDYNGRAKFFKNILFGKADYRLGDKVHRSIVQI